MITPRPCLCPRSLRRGPLRLVLCACLLAALVVAFAVAAPAQAQEEAEPDYVDVGLTLEIPHGGEPTSFPVNIVVVNHGTKTAYDVKVVADVVYPNIILGDTDYKSGFRLSGRSDAPVGALYLDGTALHWTIPALGRWQRVELAAEVAHSRLVASQHVGNSSYPHEVSADVTTESFDSDEQNDTDRIWTYRHQDGVGTRWREPVGNYLVNVDVDDPNPSPGDTVDFTVTAHKEDPRTGGIKSPPIHLKVAVELTGGLSVTGAPTYHPSGNDKPDSVSYGNGVFTVGTLLRNDRRKNSVTLPITVPADDGGEQCLTATLTGNPPPGSGPFDDDISDNVARVCLHGAPDEKVVFSDGTADLWALYPCVGVTTFPCDDSDSVVLAVNGSSAAANAGVPYPVFEPENVVVHIPDHPERRYSSSGNISWSNGHDTDNSPHGAGIRPGVVAKFERSLIGTDHYSKLRASLVPNTPGEGSNRGQVIIGFASNYAIKFFDTAEPRLSYGPNDFSSKPGVLFRFDRLGTYSLGLTMGALYDSDPDDSIPAVDPDDLYSDTETYTFHVGPIADLELSAAVTGESANGLEVTLTAANNGPDHAIDPEVRLTLPDGVSVAQATPGGAAGGTFDRSTNTWKLDDDRRIVRRDVSGNEQRGMCPRDHCRGVYGDEGATLTLLLKIDPARADIGTLILSGDIVNAGDYVARDEPANPNSLCLKIEPDEAASGSNCHTGNVYDFQPDNNSFKLELRKPVAPAMEPEKINAFRLPDGGVCYRSLPRRDDGYTDISEKYQYIEVEWQTGQPVLQYCYGDESAGQLPPGNWKNPPLAQFQAQGVNYREGVEYRFSLEAAKSPRVEFLNIPYSGGNGPEDMVLYKLSGDPQPVAGHNPRYSRELGELIARKDDGPGVAVNQCLAPGDYRLRVKPYLTDSDHPQFRKVIYHKARFSWTTAEGADCPAGVVGQGAEGQGVVGESDGVVPAYSEAQTATGSPAFDSTVATTMKLAENTPAGTRVGSPITATDPDGDLLTYFLRGEDAAAFTLGSNLHLYTREGVDYDYESKQSYSLVVEVIDNRHGMDSISITVDLVNVNEAPVFPDTTVTTLEVAEKSPAGTKVGSPVTATDPEGDPLRYIALDGADGAAFALDKETGQLTTKAGQTYDRSAKASYKFMVIVEEQGTVEGYLSGINVTVKVSEADDSAPDVTGDDGSDNGVTGDSGPTGPQQSPPVKKNRAPSFDPDVETTLALAENSPPGTNVGGPITATDPDEDPLAYSLSGADAASFAIDAATGQITARAGVAYDYEAKPSYSLSVTASDGRGLSIATSVAVNLDNVNEQPAFPGASITLAVAENSPPGTNVGAAVAAADPDAGDTLTYSLSGTDAASFAIDSTGQLATKAGVTYDFEAKSAYSLTVQATDAGGLSDSVAVTVNLTDVAETPVTACRTTVETLPAAVSYAGAWDDAECASHHQDGRARYFHFTPPADGAATVQVTVHLTAGTLYVSRDTPNNGWGAAPGGTHEQRRQVRRDNGKLLHDGPHAAETGGGGNTVTLTLEAGTTYTVEAVGADSGTFAVSLAPQ